MKKNCKNFLLVLPVMVYCLMIFIQSSYPSPSGIPQFAFSDKILHIGGYALLGILIARTLFNGNWSIRGQKLDWKLNRNLFIIAAIFLSTMYGVSDEFHQSFVAARCADIFDVFADAAGSTIGVLFFVKYKGY